MKLEGGLRSLKMTQGRLMGKKKRFLIKWCDSWCNCLIVKNSGRANYFGKNRVTTVVTSVRVKFSVSIFCPLHYSWSLSCHSEIFYCSLVFLFSTNHLLTQTNIYIWFTTWESLSNLINVLVTVHKWIGLDWLFTHKNATAETLLLFL